MKTPGIQDKVFITILFISIAGISGVMLSNVMTYNRQTLTSSLTASIKAAGLTLHPAQYWRISP